MTIPYRVHDSELALKAPNSDSWFSKLHGLTEKYGLCSPFDIIENPPTKTAWSNLVNKGVNNYYLHRLTSEAKEKKTLALLNLKDSAVGKVHNIWKSCGADPFAAIMAGIKAKIATDTLTLQIHKAKFSKNVESSAKCLLCLDESEDITHFILRCPALDDVRTPFLFKLKSLVRDSKNIRDGPFNFQVRGGGGGALVFFSKKIF